MNNYQLGEPSFDDGNVILAAESQSDDASTVVFRIHRGVIARQSEVFETMFGIPQPSTDVESLEGCQVVRMHDPPLELSNLLMALYDGPKLKNNSFPAFLHLAGILRLSTKYMILSLRSECIHVLSKVWAHNLQGHDDMVSLALRSPLVDDMSYPYVHPLHVINLCRETHIQSLLPSAFYFLSLYPATPELFQGLHPKLRQTSLPSHPRPPSSVFSSSDNDISLYTMMFQHRIETIMEFTRVFCGTRTPNSATCAWSLGANKSRCQRGFTRLSSRLSRSWMTRTGPLHYILQAINDVKADVSGFCAPCRDSFETDAERLRQELWSKLPSVLLLPDFETLIEADFGDGLGQRS